MARPGIRNSFQLLWERMAHLVQGCPEALNQLEAELDAFIETMDKQK